MFESNVILNRFKTEFLKENPDDMFESNVILNRFKTYGNSKQARL